MVKAVLPTPPSPRTTNLYRVILPAILGRFPSGLLTLRYADSKSAKEPTKLQRPDAKSCEERRAFEVAPLDGFEDGTSRVALCYIWERGSRQVWGFAVEQDNGSLVNSLKRPLRFRLPIPI